MPFSEQINCCKKSCKRGSDKNDHAPRTATAYKQYVHCSQSRIIKRPRPPLINPNGHEAGSVRFAVPFNFLDSGLPLSDEPSRPINRVLGRRGPPLPFPSEFLFPRLVFLSSSLLPCSALGFLRVSPAARRYRSRALCKVPSGLHRRGRAYVGESEFGLCQRVRSFI